MSENTQKHSSFKNSLLFLACKQVVEEIKSPENQWFAGEHFHNDPREHKGERITHYILSGRASKVMREFKDSHPELISEIGREDDKNILTKSNKVAA